VDARRSPKGPTRSVRPSKRRGSHNGGLPAASRTSRKTTSLKGRLCGVIGLPDSIITFHEGKAALAEVEAAEAAEDEDNSGE
jgi:hypothetical protein